MWCSWSCSTTFCSNFSSCPACPPCSLISLLSSIPAYQIQQREQKNPDDVDKVPIQPEVLDISNVPRCVRPCSRSHEHEPQNRDADNHVQRVHASHGEIEKEVHLSLRGHVGRQWLVLRVQLVNL